MKKNAIEFDNSGMEYRIFRGAPHIKATKNKDFCRKIESVKWKTLSQFIEGFIFD